MIDLAARVVATERVVARFRGRPFDWRKRRTCIHLARAQAFALGHRPPRVPDFHSPTGARRALLGQGHETLEALLDSLFPRIAPAAMMVGDIAQMAGGDGFGGLVLNAGGKVIGYHEDHLADGLVNIVPQGERPFVAAWRL